MNKEIIYFTLPLIGILGGAVTRRIIDGKLRNILQAQGKNPNPPELEIIKGVIYPGQHKKRMREDVAFRKNIDEKLGQLYKSTYTFHLIMFLCFVALIILMGINGS